MTNDVLLVYIHGAGDQDRKTGDQLKVEYDDALFGAPGPSEAVTWWQVFWTDPGSDAREAELDAVVERIAQQPSDPESDAAELLEAIRTARPPLPWSGPEAVGVAELTNEALGSIRDFYIAADEAAGATEMPDWIFRLLAGRASKDVVPYLYDGWAERMREPVRQRLRALGTDQRLVVLAHSLGSILAYDLIADVEFAGWPLELFVTAGTPLGIKNVVAKVRDRRGPGDLPSSLTGWQNFYDPRDFVAKFGESLANKYRPLPPLTEKLTVDNPRDGHHDLVGYLADPDLRRVARAAVGLP